MSKRPRGAITLVQIKTLLARIGSGVGGTKPELTQRLYSDLDVPKLQDVSSSKTGRILSVDMGIRNMAFCVCDVEVRRPSKSSSSTKPSVKLSVLAWAPISVSDLAAQEEQAASDPATKLSSQLSQAGKESFRPSILSRAAYALLKRTLLPYAPNTVLIEQQRYRTNASAAIQEWTYHVNMLEGMIWAILETLKQESSDRLILPAAAAATAASKKAAPPPPPFPSVFPVSPARVATFWMENSELGRAIRDESLAGVTPTRRRSSPRSRAAAEEKEEEEVAEGVEEEGDGIPATKPKKLSKTKVEKRVKIKLVEQWLLQNAAASAAARTTKAATAAAAAAPASDCDVELSFATPEARGMRDVFLSKLSRAAKRGGGGGKKKTTTTTTTTTAATAAAAAAEALVQASDRTSQQQPAADPKKLDDLADCLLQAAAWAQWEGNRRAMLGLDENALKEVAGSSS